MRVAHLFAGAGGGLYADLILGHEPVLAVEQDSYCCCVLRLRRDEGWWPELEVWEGDIRDWKPGDWAGRVDCIAAGFPCQDISSAGSRVGVRGPKSGLVWEVFRAVDAIRPKFIFLENSPDIRTRGRREIVAALLSRGYTWRDGALAASDVGAPHQRKRWWLLAANPDGQRQLQQAWRKRQERERTGDCAPASPNACCVRQPQTGAQQQVSQAREQERQAVVATFCGSGATADYARISRDDRRAIEAIRSYTGRVWTPPDADRGRVAHGMADREHRIRALGNGQVPLQAAAAWTLLSTD